MPTFVILLLLGAIFWAKWQDPFSRKWFTLKTRDDNSVKCVAVLSKPMRQYPVIIYAHGSGDTLMTDGDDIRQMAELGLAVVSLEYNQTNEAAFDPQLENLLSWIDRQKWADTNAIAWVGFGLGANCMFDFALQHPNQQPQLLVQLSDAGVREQQTNSRLILLRCPILLIHGDKDETFPVVDVRRMASIVRANGLPIQLKIIPGAPHAMGSDRTVIFRTIGEYCLAHLVGSEAWQNYNSIAEQQEEAPPFWLFCLPAVAWAIGRLAWRRYHNASPLEKLKLKRHEIALRWLAALLATWVLAFTAIHLATPQFSISDKTLNLARRFLVQPNEREDFEHLAVQPIWRGQKLQALLAHVELAGYNRELINWQLDDEHYRDYVLSPVITGTFEEKFNWRRPLWEEFYPRIRRENLPEDAARIVVRHLRGRVTVIVAPNMPHDVPAIWLKQITDESGFEIIYVAALRSVGVPAQLNSEHQAEFWDGTKWKIAPPPPVFAW